MFSCKGKDACVELMLLVTAVLSLALASLSFSFSSALSPVCFQQAHSVSLIVTISDLITDPSAHCLRYREIAQAKSSFEENIDTLLTFERTDLFVAFPVQQTFQIKLFHTS